MVLETTPRSLVAEAPIDLSPRAPQSLGTFLAGRLADLGVNHIFSVPGDFSVGPSLACIVPWHPGVKKVVINLLLTQIQTSTCSSYCLTSWSWMIGYRSSAAATSLMQGVCPRSEGFWQIKRTYACGCSCMQSLPLCLPLCAQVCS